jgi:hypothetical protein
MLLAVGMTFWGWRLFGDVVSSTVSIGELRADLTLQGVELRSGQNGTLEWTLNAREAEYDTAQEIIALQDPRITYFGRSEEESLIMEARHGEDPADGEPGQTVAQCDRGFGRHQDRAPWRWNISEPRKWSCSRGGDHDQTRVRL